MKAHRRRTRRADPLASAQAVAALLDSLRAALPDLIPHSHKQLSSLLNSVRGLYLRPEAAPGRGRLPRYSREQLLRVDGCLRELLGRETRLSVRSFVGQYVPILEFPEEVREALGRGEINLFEAHQVARLRAKRLGCAEREARALRRRVLEAHVSGRGSGTQLRARVKEVLGERSEPDATQTEVAAVLKADEMLEADPLDAGHLFFEELRMVGRALREVGAGEVTEEEMAELMPAVDQTTLTLQRIERRRERERARKLST